MDAQHRHRREPNRCRTEDSSFLQRSYTLSDEHYGHDHQQPGSDVGKCLEAVERCI